LFKSSSLALPRKS